jgi:lysophospholipase L1-like esterase
MMFLRSLFGLLLFTTACWSAAPEKTRQRLAEAGQPVRIICIGDSITGVYYHSGGVRAYPEMLQVALRKLHPAAPVSVRNAGISGDTSKGGLARLERDVLAHQPHLVTVMFGMNDLVRVPIPEFVQNQREIIRRCRAAGAEVVLCTQNRIIDTPQRPVGRFAEYSKAIRDLAAAESVPLADCHAAFEAAHHSDPLAASFLLSDAIHPNMDGHKLFAETIAKTITGQNVSLREEPPPPNPLAHTLKLLGAGRPVTVHAMPPFDQHIEAALRKFHPGAQIRVNSWPTEGRTLSDLVNAAKAVRALKPDLVLIAVPGHLGAPNPPAFHQSFAWILNWSLSFGPQEWDVVVALPSAAKPVLDAAEQANQDLARQLVKAQDLSLIERPPGSAVPLPDLLAKWVESQKP